MNDFDFINRQLAALSCRQPFHFSPIEILTLISTGVENPSLISEKIGAVHPSVIYRRIKLLIAEGFILETVSGREVNYTLTAKAKKALKLVSELT